MTKNEIVGRLKDGGLDASTTNRSAAVYVTDARSGRAEAGWFSYRIVCNSDETERRARAILSRWYDIETSGDVWRLKSKNRIPLMAIKRGAAPSANGYMYLEAAQANSTISMVSTLETAPDLEYSTDGVTWQEWQHTTADDTHTFDTITLGAIGDKVYFRGDNPEGLGNWDDELYSTFVLTGAINAGGNVMSLLDVTEELTEVPDNGLCMLFCDLTFGEAPVPLLTAPDMSTITAIGYGGCASMYSGCTSLTSASDMPSLTTIGEHGCDSMYSGCTSLTSAADMPSLTAIGEAGCSAIYSGCTSLTSAADMPSLTAIGYGGCDRMYFGCTSLTSASDMPSLTTIGEHGCYVMYSGCTFNMSDDGTTLNFDFPTPPVTAGETTYSTAYDIAQWMGNTNGF